MLNNKDLTIADGVAAVDIKIKVKGRKVMDRQDWTEYIKTLSGGRMRIIIFGASGRTGRPLVKQALDEGHEVIAFVRDPAKLNIEHEHLTVVQGDATDPDLVERAVHGVNAVISVMATAASQKIAGTMPLTRSTQNILAAMEKHGVRRLIISSAGIPQPEDLPDIRFKLLMGLVKFIAPYSYKDTAGSVQAIRESETDWTVVRMPAPSNSPGTYKVNAGHVSKKALLRISRSDAAAFILNELKEPKYIKQSPVIFNI